MDDNKPTFGSTLKFFRAHTGLRQQDIADILHISRAAYSRYENDDALPDVEMACRLAEALGTTLYNLLAKAFPSLKTDPLKSLPEDYQHILHAYNRLTLKDRESLRVFIEFLEYQQNKAKKENAQKTP